MSGQTVNQTVTVKVNGSSCCPDPCPANNYATQAELSAGLSSLSTAIGEIVITSSVTPENLSTLSTSIGLLTNSTAAGLSSLSTSIGLITGSTVTPANISTLSTPIGINTRDIALIVNYDIPALEAGLSSLSTSFSKSLESGLSSISTVLGSGSSNTPIGANISTIQPLYSTLTMNLSTLVFPTSTNVYGNVNFVNGVSLGGNLNFNNNIQLAQNNIPYFLFSTSALQVSSIYTSSFLIPVTQSLQSIDFILAGANGASYSNNVEGNTQTKNGGLGAWIQGTLHIPSSFYGKTLEVKLPSSIGARYPTSIRLLETGTDLIYAGNGGSAAFIDDVPISYINNFGAGGNAGRLNQNASDGQSIFYTSGFIVDAFGSNTNSTFTSYVSGGIAAKTTLNGLGGEYFHTTPPGVPPYDSQIYIAGVIQPGLYYQYADQHAYGSNGLNYIGGYGGLYNCNLAYGGDGGGGYYAGGGGACVTSFNEDGSVYYQNEISAGGGGGTSYINSNYVTVTSNALNNTVPSTLSSFTSTASALFNFTTNVFTFYGSLQINGPSGVNAYIRPF